MALKPDQLLKLEKKSLLVVAPKAVRSLPSLQVENKAYPLKKSSSFKKVSKSCKKLRLSGWLTLQVMPSEDSKNYYGITASGKVGNSVTRNKLKRWVRNCVQTEKWPEKYKFCTFVFVFKPQAEPKFFSNLKYSDFKTLFSEL